MGGHLLPAVGAGEVLVPSCIPVQTRRAVPCLAAHPLPGSPCLRKPCASSGNSLTPSGDCHSEAPQPSVPSAGFEGDPQAVLQTIRRYVHTFFGCKECGEHFEEMAKESMDSVKTPDQAVLWLWKKHNQVNNRLAGEKPRRSGLSLGERGQCGRGR